MSLFRALARARDHELATDERETVELDAAARDRLLGAIEGLQAQERHARRRAFQRRAAFVLLFFVALAWSLHRDRERAREHQHQPTPIEGSAR